MIAAAALGGFVAGVVAGILFRDAFLIATTGKGYLVTTVRRLAGSRTFLVLLVVVALLVNAATGFLQIATRAAVEDGAKRDALLVECVAGSFARLGDALVDRDAAFDSSTDAEIGLWNEYDRLYKLAKAADSRGDEAALERIQTRFYDRVGRYVDELEAVQSTRDTNPYPDPDLCRTLR